MGKISERFSNLTYRNEDHVKQIFIIPLLTEYLGYKLNEIIPEEKFPAKEVHSGVYKKGDTKGLTNKPDYIICIDGNLENPKFILDAKDSNIKIDNHIPQIKSYSISVGTNLIVITNGYALKVFDVNNLLFVADSIDQLDYKFTELLKILGRYNQATKNLKVIIESIDDKIALNVTEDDINNNELGIKRIKLSDFSEYLDLCINEFQDWHIPSNFQGLNNLNLKSFNPDYLHTFHIYRLSNLFDPSLNKEYTLRQILNNFKIGPIIIIGETGIGKTSILRFLTLNDCLSCKKLRQTDIPIYISLKNINDKISIFDIVKRELELHGYMVNSIYNEINKNDFTIYLDAYDEIPESQLIGFNNELDILLSKSKCKCILTTRERRIPKLKSANLFKIKSLTDDKIEEIAKYYFDVNYYSFIIEIVSKGLYVEAGNTLLLLLMISIYKEEKTLPMSVNEITHKILNRFSEWEKQKTPEQKHYISWETRESLISEIAYFMIEQNVTVISIPDLKNLLNPIIDEFQTSKEISNAINIEEVIESLLVTGIILKNENNIYFWHRVFQNYYASSKLAIKINKDIGIIELKKNLLIWTPIIRGASSHLEDSSELVKSLESNLWMQSICLIVSKFVSEEVMLNTIEKLSKMCNSKFLTNRDKALSMLTKIDRKYTRETYWKLHNENIYIDVRMTALEEIAKEKTNSAKDLVLKNITIDENIGVIGRFSVLSIIRALANFEELELLRILEIWKRKPDIFSSEECSKIFKVAYRKGKITDKIEQSLYELFFDFIDSDSLKLNEITKILCLINNEKYINLLLQKLVEQSTKNVLATSEIANLLSHYETESAFKTIVSYCLSDNEIIAKISSSVIRTIKYQFSLDEIKELFDSSSVVVKLNAIHSLSRFPFEEVKDHIFKFLNSSDKLEHNSAFEIICENGFIVEIAKENKLPNSINRANISTFLKAVKRYKIQETINVVDKIYENSDHYFGSLIEIATTYASIGFENKGMEIIKKIYDESGRIIYHQGIYDLVNLLDILPEFNKDFASEVLQDIFAQFNSEIISERNGYFEGKYLEAVEKIGTEELKETVKTIINYAIEQMENGLLKEILIERPLRTITRIGSSDDENWILEILNKKINLSKIDLRRAIHCIKVFGTDKSIPTLQKIARESYMKLDENKYFNEILNICFESYESILLRKGLSIQLTDDEVFGNHS